MVSVAIRLLLFSIMFLSHSSLALLASQSGWSALQTKGYIRGELPQRTRSQSDGGEDLDYNMDSRLEFSWFADSVGVDSVVYAKYRNQYSDARQDVQEELEYDANVRELYATFEGYSWMLKLGRQQVAWGKGDYFRIVDVINPLDLREGLLPYLDDYSLGRKTRDMAVGEYYQGDIEYQIVIAKGRNQTEYAPLGADFAVQGLPEVEVDDESRPDIGLRTRIFSEFGDFDIYAFKGTSPEPQFYMDQQAIKGTLNDRVLMAVSSAFANDLGVVRTDIAYYVEEPLQVGLESTSIQKLDALVGLDIMQGEWTWNLQLSASQLLGVPNLYANNKNVYNASLALDKEWPQHRLVSSLIWLANYQDHTSHLVKYSMAYDWFSGTQVELGVIGFAGDQNSLHGQYANQDRIYLNMKQQFSF